LFIHRERIGLMMSGRPTKTLTHHPSGTLAFDRFFRLKSG